MNKVKYIGSDKIEGLKPILQKDGVVVVKDFLSQDELQEMIRNYNLLLQEKDNLKGVKVIDYSNGEAVLVKKDELSDDLFIKSYLNKALFQQLVDLYFGKGVIANDSFFCNLDVVGTEHIAQDMHFDVSRTLKFFFYLNDVSETNGAFKCIPGSQRHVLKVRNKYKYKINYSNRGLTRINDFNDEAVHVSGKAGDMIIFDTDVLHCAGVVSEGKRKVLRAQSSPYNFVFEPSFFEKVKFKLKKGFKK